MVSTSTDSLENIEQQLNELKIKFENSKKKQEEFNNDVFHMGLGIFIGSFITAFYICSNYNVR